MADHGRYTGQPSEHHAGPNQILAAIAFLPPGQQYFIPAEIENPGLLLAAQIILPRINRSPSVRQTVVEFVLPI
jgi:hypothetical protein